MIPLSTLHTRTFSHHKHFDHDMLIRKDYQGMEIASQLCWPINSLCTFCWERRIFDVEIYDNPDYKENKSGTKHPFVPSSCSPSRDFYTHTAFSVDAGMIKVKPTIVWLPRLSPQMVGSAPSNHYLGGRVARPLNGLPHAPLAYHR